MYRDQSGEFVCGYCMGLNGITHKEVLVMKNILVKLLPN